MDDVRIREKTYVPSARSVELASYAVSLHGFVLLVAWHAPLQTSPMLAAAALLAALVPWGVWIAARSRRPQLALGLGVVPAVWLAAAALMTSPGDAPPNALDALRSTVGLFAHLGAAFERARARTASTQTVSTSPYVLSSRSEPLRRHRVRLSLLVLLLLPLSLVVLVAPFLPAGATRYERTFAAVAATVLVSSLALTLLPSLVRRERTAPRSVRSRVRTAGLAVGFALLLLALDQLGR